MNISFFLSAGGLFDFDLTFVAEALLFFILALVVTFVFLSPISDQLEKRAESINFTLRKSTILLTFGYEKLSTLTPLLIQEISELNRQLKEIEIYTNSNFEAEILSIQEKSFKIINKLKGRLCGQSRTLFLVVQKELDDFTKDIIKVKFQLF